MAARNANDFRATRSMIELLPTDFDGLLLIGHGTRDPAGLAEFWQLVELLRREQPDWQIEGCLLELAQPTIAEGLGNLIRRGTHRVRVVPLVLFAAGHAKRDIPAALATAADEHPGVVIDQAPHLGCHEAIVELSERRFHEAIRDHQKVAVGQTLLLLVGRGSHDREATGQMRQFAACRAAQSAGAHRDRVYRDGRAAIGGRPASGIAVEICAMRRAAAPAVCRSAAYRLAGGRRPRGCKCARKRMDLGRSVGAGYPPGSGGGGDRGGEIVSPRVESKNQSPTDYVWKDVPRAGRQRLYARRGA